MWVESLVRAFGKLPPSPFFENLYAKLCLRHWEYKRQRGFGLLLKKPAPKQKIVNCAQGERDARGSRRVSGVRPENSSRKRWGEIDHGLGFRMRVDQPKNALLVTDHRKANSS